MLKLPKMLKILSLASIFSINCLSADVLIDTTSVNVTLNLSAAHSLTVTNLDFGSVNPVTISGESSPLESTTGSILAYSNSTAGHYVRIVPSNSTYVSEDGFSFLMLGQTNGNTDSIPFILNTTLAADGSAITASPNYRQIIPGDTIIGVDGSDGSHRVSRDLWASLRDNSVLQSISSDVYLAVLTANHYSNQ